MGIESKIPRVCKRKSLEYRGLKPIPKSRLWAEDAENIEKIDLAYQEVRPPTREFHPILNKGKSEAQAIDSKPSEKF